jgi:hypothetical protein
MRIQSRFLRVTIALVAMLGAGSAVPAGAGVPCSPGERSTIVLSAPGSSGQFRVNSAGSLDVLAVDLTLLDCFDQPIPFCDVGATVVPQSGTLALCSCEPMPQLHQTDAAGAARFEFSRIGGRGHAAVNLTAYCAGAIGFASVPFDFTSPDLNGSCEPAPGSATNVVDLGLWVSGLTSYRVASDFDCSGTVDVVDLGLWASGLGNGCK